MRSFLKELVGRPQRVWQVARGLVRCPLVGEIDKRFLVVPPTMPTREFGDTTHLPTVLEIIVSPDRIWPLDIGRKVDAVFFEDDPTIVFNVSFSCAKPSLLRGGDYANPASIWFNVFFGYYEIDVPIGPWTRPFGFVDDKGLDPCWDDLLRIGKSDWNYFSNYVYGVPEAECAKHDAIPGGAKCAVRDKAVPIGPHTYVEGQVEGLEVVSGYVSGQDGKKLLNNVCGFSPLWRAVFGRPKRSESHADSFVPTTMRMRFWARHDRGYDPDLECEAYKTFIYGGTANMGYSDAPRNAAFLDAQMEGVRAAITHTPFAKRAQPKRRAPWKK
jgi:hypothetical protein